MDTEEYKRIKILTPEAFFIFMAKNHDFLKVAEEVANNGLRIKGDREEIASWLRKLRKSKVKFKLITHK
jgi:hypothetical protein